MARGGGRAGLNTKSALGSRFGNLFYSDSVAAAKKENVQIWAGQTFSNGVLISRITAGLRKVWEHGGLASAGLRACRGLAGCSTYLEFWLKSPHIMST